jgi:hypothetical protein
MPDRCGGLVLFPYPVCICATPPGPQSDEVSGGILINKDLMRDITIEASHVGPHLPC